MKLGIIAAAALTLLGIGVADAETVTINPALAQIVEAAKTEGKLSLRSTAALFGGADGAKRAQDAINKAFGTKLVIEWTPGPAYGPLAAILYQEFQAGQPASTDVYMASAVQITGYLDKGLFQKIDWPNLLPERVTPAMVEGEGRALRFQTVLQGILYNMKTAPWAADINTTADFLKPQYKGKFYTTPFLSGFDVLLADDVWGKPKTEAFVRQYALQIAGLAGCEASDRVASGEIPALFSCTGGSTRREEFRGKGIIGIHIVSDLAQKRENYMTIPTNAPHPNAAILYALYMMTHDGQENLIYDIIGNDLSDFPDSHVRTEISRLAAKGVQFIDVTIDWWRAHPGLDEANNALAKLVREK
jgi:iron(III) transport system substrate-binding protein